MIPLNEFVAAATTTRQRRVRLALGSTLIFLISAACFVLFAIWIQPLASSTMTIALPVFFIWLFGGALWTILRDPTPRCPHCSKKNTQNYAWTVATRNCCNCGRRILSEPASGDGWIHGGISAPELYAKTVQVRERRWQALSWFSTISAIGFVLFFVLSRTVMDALSAHFNQGDAVFLWALAILAVLMIVLGLLGWHVRNVDSRFALRCPHCASQLLNHCSQVLMTGNCSHCGRRIIHQSLQSAVHPGLADDAVLTIETFRAACRLRVKKFMALGAAALGGMIVGIVAGGFLIIFITGSDVIENPQWYHFAIMYAPMTLALAIAVYFGLKLEPDPQLQCPLCKTDLAKDFGAAAIATRRCTLCGCRLLADP